MAKRNSITLIISLISLLIAVLALYCNWQSFIFSNRPYVKIIPIMVKDTKEFCHIKKVDSNDFIINFRFQLKNIGHAPANDIHVKHEVGWMIKLFPEKNIKGENVKAALVNLKNSDTLDFPFINGEQIDDESMQNFLKEMKSKDIVMTNLYKKWKSLSLFPGEVFEYDSGVEVIGKDANWMIENFNKIKFFELDVEVFYRGILPLIGKPYYSKYKAIFNKNVITPYESETL